ncbi:recombinase family protein [Streptomyces sp. RB6PN25]|uniref:Recombinase family protein n=1 Tax=Streptomyces humicola TaxID=2953240 RepID=A0ABT1PX23_9ACTN|nr:recombinase family protein [Streptomyces humicola]MCQ4082226.1 recombinase family protein [Streptomyces humicola]
MREDQPTLEALGFTAKELAEMGLDKPAEGEPSELLEAYLRRSKKREDLAALRGHLKDIVRWAQGQGLQIRRVWFEQLSASKTYVRRREFEKATQAILEGQSKTLAVWKTDRFDRRGMGAVGRMLDEFDMRRARLVSVTESLDSSTSGARIIFGILSERAREEAKDIGLRVKNGHDEHKGEGRRGTGRPPFGLYGPTGSGKVQPHEMEFAAARRLADLLLEGMTTTRTAWKLNEEGYRTRSGKSWSGTAVSKLAQSPLFAGMVPNRMRKTDEHGNPLDVWEGYGEPLTDAEGNPVMCGEGVVTVAEWYKIKSLIGERTDQNRRSGKPAVRYLCTSILRCGRCKGPMSHRGGRYRCDRRQQRGASICPGVVSLAARIDFAVAQAWMAHVISLEPEDPVLITIGRRWLSFSDPETQARKEHAREALESARKRVKKLEDDYYVYGKLTEERYEELSAAQQATIESMTSTLEELDRATDLSPLRDGEMLAKAWDDDETTIDDKRMLLRCALKKVTLKPAARQGDHTPIEDRLVYDWVSSSDAE